MVSISERGGTILDEAARARLLATALTADEVQEIVDAVMAEMVGLGGTGGLIYLTPWGHQGYAFRTPGMYFNHPRLRELMKAGAAVTSELELFMQCCPCPIIGVTGSDGKTTTTSLIAEMLRQSGNDVPILVLTARDADNDRVDGLDAGGDDYMAKPFALDELLARLRALTRRSRTPGEAGSSASTELLTFADMTLDPQTREVERAGRRISLTRTEFALLQTFMEHPRRVLERGWLLNEVWGFDFPTTANSLEVYIGYLRRKTEQDGEARLIHTVRGIGYVLRETPP